MPERNGRRRERLAVLVVLLTVLAALLGACAAPAPAPQVNLFETAAGPVRTDRLPIARRFPGLSGFVAAYWVTGRLGVSDRSGAGPSETFVQAVVVVPAETRARLLRLAGVGRSGPPTDVVSNLDPLLPSGDRWQAGEYHDAVAPGWTTRLWVRPDSPVVYVSSTAADSGAVSAPG